MNTWVINTNSNTCHIYEYQKNTALRLLKSMEHLENKLKNQELVSDGPGHYRAGKHNRGAYAYTNTRENHIDQFAREIATTLNQGRNEQAYENLVVIAEPHMNGLLFKHLDKHVCQQVANNIQKDVIFLKPHELLDFLKEHAAYPDARKH